MPTPRILIISSNPGTRLDIRELLRADLYEIFEVSNHHEAQVYHSHISPRVVFLDTGLPEGSALTFLDQCPPDPTGPCEIIGFGDSDSLAEQDRYFERGLSHILPLPLDPSRVRGVTSNAIKLRATLEDLRAQAGQASLSPSSGDPEATPGTRRDLLASLHRNLPSPIKLLAHCTELLRQTHLSPQQLTWVTSIDGATHALSQITRDVHQLQENPAAPLSITQERFNLQTLLNHYVQQQSPLAREHGQELSLQYAPQAPRHLLGDPRRILQMTQNLLDCVLSLPSQGALHLELQGRSFSDYAQIRLSLHSPQPTSLPPGAPQALDPISTLAQGDALTLCRQLAERMEGLVGVESHPVKGSQLWFKIKLPLASAPVHNAAPAPSPVPHPGPTRSVLLVEDDALTTKLVRNLLERLHCEVEVAGNGREAVQKSSRRIYDAILLDYNLPLMNGMEVTRLIRANEVRARLDPTPVIILTGDARLDKTDAWYHAGVTAHLVKPFEFDDLAATLEQTLKDAPSLPPPHAQAQPQG